MSSIANLALRPLRAGRAAAALTAAAALLSLTACGGPAGADAPADAAVDEFCAVVADLDVSDPEKFIEDLVDVGTPDGIPQEAREGFEALIDNADADEVSDRVQEQVNAFLAYLAQTCGGFPAGDPAS